ncbi:MAG: YkgJ family cysteine cluster protein [Deltaproteobacteria bacterium]|nr:YkgJ family cysteine cluster protein [Deltaproteobacteria bacterium]
MSSQPLSAPRSLAPSERLALTCTRAGACCHGNAVWLNPWELARLAVALELPPAAFRDRYTELGGIRLAFDGPVVAAWGAACRLYGGAALGCRAHAARPLACRLYPLARARAGDAVAYGFAGRGATALPCHATCPEVAALPELTVGDYLAEQGVAAGEEAQDAYLAVVEALADGAFVLLFDSGLAATGDRATLRGWRALGAASAEARLDAIPAEWRDRLAVPGVDPALIATPSAFVAAHEALIQAAAQAAFARLDSAAALSAASTLMMALALHLGRAVGADPAALSARWTARARELGAR